MPLPTRPPEWGMMRSPLFRMAAITATLVPCQSRRRCSRRSWALKRSSWGDAQLRAVRRGRQGCLGVGDCHPMPPAQPQCQAGGMGDRVPVCPWPAGLKPPLGGEAWSPKAVLGCNQSIPTVGQGY